jgi:hypothetical protein
MHLPEVADLAHAMATYYFNFAATGDPNKGSSTRDSNEDNKGSSTHDSNEDSHLPKTRDTHLPTWPRFESSTGGQCLQLDIASSGGIRAVPKMKVEECVFMEAWIEGELHKAGLARREAMQVCSGKCTDDCMTYHPPLNECYSPPKLWPGDVQWGDSDTLDVCNATHLVRSFYPSTNGSCTGDADDFTLPLHTCVGPFGKPRPWGNFSCDASPRELLL